MPQSTIYVQLREEVALNIYGCNLSKYDQMTRKVQSRKQTKRDMEWRE